MVKLFLAEDNADLMRLMKLHLEQEGYKDLITAFSIAQAIDPDKIKEIKEAGVKIAVLDGNLGTSNAGEDGEKIAQVLRQEIPGIKIISFSFTKVSFGDINVKKPEAEELLAAIKKFE